MVDSVEHTLSRRPRLTGFSNGKILFDRDNSVIGCTIINLSARGARLKLAAPLQVPDNFTLVIGEGRAATEECSVLWRSRSERGTVFVEFNTPSKRSSRTGNHAVAERPALPEALVISQKSQQEWFIERSDGNHLGPYWSSKLALQITAMELASARRRASTDVFVRDDYGAAHKCALFEQKDQCPCLACENSWATKARPIPPRCPIWEAIRAA